MEIVTTILGKIGECMFESIKHQFVDLTAYDDNIVALESQLETLENREKDVLEAIGAANRNGEIIRNTAQHWITRVERVKMEARKFLEDNVKVNKRCFRGWFPDLKTRYKLNREAVSKSQMMKSLCEEGASFDINVALPAPTLGVDSMTSKDFVLFQTTELAMQEAMAALRDNSTNFVGIHGMGGVGKTTLVKEIARKCKEVKLFDNVAFAVVSQTVSVEGIQNQIAEFLGLRLGQTSQTIRANRLCDRLKKEKKILVILDDVWASIEPATIGIPSEEDHKGCKVVVTTRRRQVCTVMGRSSQGPRIVSLNVLNKQESWELFKLQVGEIIESPTVRIVAEKLVKECGGLPIALVTVGRAMIDKDKEEWKAAALDLEKSRPTNVGDMDKNVFKCIKFSYHYLGDEEAKACFLLCCLFPDDYDIEIERLVRYGVGLNTFKGIDKIHEARRRAHSIINNLKASSLLAASEKEGCIKMHDIIRDVAKDIALDKYFVKDGEVKEWPNELGMNEYNGLGISLMRNEIEKYPDAWQCPNLKIFLTHHYNAEQVIPEEVFKGLKKLRVLDQNHHTYYRKRSLESSVSHLTHLTNLQTLIIVGIGFIDLPIQGISALGELKMLQVVSFRNLRFEEPLDALRKLKNLRLLTLESCFGCSSLFDYTRIDDEDCNFPQLEELNVTGQYMPCSVAELIKCHPRLNVLKFCIDDFSRIPENFVFPHLDSFSICVGASYNFFGHYLENTLLLNRSYPRLDMTWVNRIGTLLSGATIWDLSGLDGVRNILPCLLVSRDSLAVLKKLTVHYCENFEFLINIEVESKIPPPTSFLYLEGLYLRGLEKFRGLCGMVLADMPYSFTRLKALEYCDNMSNIGVPFYLLRRMRQLEDLEIESCGGIKYLFDIEEEEVKNAVVEEEGILVNLTKMSLDFLPNLEQLWKGSIRLLQLRNLKTLCLIRCPKLKVIFHWPVAQRLEQLEKLKVSGCDELEEIVERETVEEATGLVPFRNLKTVKVEWCPKLKVVFHWSVAQRLKQLEELTVSYCKELEEVVGRETGEEAAHKVFPELQHLHIRKLPKLVGFHIGTPKLKTVHITTPHPHPEPDVEIAVDINNLDTVIKDHKELLL